MRTLSEKEVRRRLKACPCGNGNLVTVIDDDDCCSVTLFIRCEHCEQTLFDGLLPAIHRWNKRIDL